uniref:Uncharacterized protein n=1 Tax=Anguilla anguilla TaxID=7936 RepID=A0A0E9PPW4_ANGAN
MTQNGLLKTIASGILSPRTACSERARVNRENGKAVFSFQRPHIKLSTQIVLLRFGT